MRSLRLLMPISLALGCSGDKHTDDTGASDDGGTDDSGSANGPATGAYVGTASGDLSVVTTGESYQCEGGSADLVVSPYRTRIWVTGAWICPLPTFVPSDGVSGDLTGTVSGEMNDDGTASGEVVWVIDALDLEITTTAWTGALVDTSFTGSAEADLNVSGFGSMHITTAFDTTLQ